MKKLFIIFAVVCLAAPVMAADWNFYGSARFATVSVNQDTDTDIKNDSVTNTQWDQQGNSRIGATVKFNDEIGGGFEMSDSFGKRKLYGTYTFGNGSELLLGQTYTPTAWFLSNSVFDGDGDLLGIGEFYEGRLPMIQLKMGGFKVALIKPNVEGEEITAAATTADLTTGEVTTTAAVSYDTEVSFPKIEVAYNFKSDMFFLSPYVGYQTYKLLGTTDAYDDQDIDSYIVGVGGGVNFGALYINAGFHYGQNLGNYGAYESSTLASADTLLTNSAVVRAADNEVKDTDCWGALGVIGFNASEMLTIEAGYGYEYGEQDVDGADGSSVYQMYLNATINIAPGFFIVPEVGYAEADGETYGDSNDPNPSTTYFGAKWQINF
jgi:hypothetical protein